MKSLDELARIREESKKLTNLRENGEAIRINVGMGTEGSRGTVLAFLEELEKKNVDAVVTQTANLDEANQAPVVELQIPGNNKVVYMKIDAEKARRIVADHIIGGNVISEWVIR